MARLYTVQYVTVDLSVIEISCKRFTITSNIVIIHSEMSNTGLCGDGPTVGTRLYTV